MGEHAKAETGGVTVDDLNWMAVVLQIGLAIVTMVGAALTARNTRQSTRDRMEYDAERHELLGKVANLTAQVDQYRADRDEYKKDRDELRIALVACEAKHDAAIAHTAHQDAEIGRLRAEVTNLQAELAQLKAQQGHS